MKMKEIPPEKKHTLSQKGEEKTQATDLCLLHICLEVLYQKILKHITLTNT